MYPAYYIEIITPERVFYQGMIEELIVEGLDGQIGILKNMMPSVVGLKAGIMRFLTPDGEWKNAAASAGFAVVRHDDVTVLCDTVEWPEEIDEAQVKREIEREEENMRHKLSYRDYMLSKANIARAFAEMKLKSKE
ncbi:MAG: ATP synthase F1 subunit epsilon [Clostridiales bacterium]|jgi:F-type H+-transporting ATPase subunit epsilon|nr:ATP synthase F1 subunit epsilon [Clostridiales bacterium]